MVFKWSREQIEKLINCVEQNSCIYNVKSEEYLDRKKKSEAFNSILKEMHKLDRTITLEEIKRRWTNLRTQYRQEIRAIKQSEKFGSGRANLYVPKLWCFGHLNFLTTQSNRKASQDVIFQTDNKTCRICLEENGELNWNDFLCNHSHLTYKDCFYKYTQLEYFDGDNFPNMLCKICSNSLESIDNFISKAIETHNSLLQKLPLDTTNKNQNDIEQEENNFEMVFVEDTDIKPEVEVFFEENETSSISTMSYTVLKQDIPLDDEVFPKETEENMTSSIFQQPDTAQKRTLRKPLKRKNDHIEEKKKKRIEHPMCCTICSKVLSSKYKVIEHEETHYENRERNESCDECGLRFHKKHSLDLHKLTHIENREKTHKCEFCEKAFYNKGALNVHRRIHLGQMISCTLCTKQFYRQVDLDKHLISHSATRINSSIKITKKFFVCCEYCGESVRSVAYKSHTAKHTNMPLFKCAICNKEFFSRRSCTQHLQKVHKKGSGERSNFVIAYTSNRCSHLFLQQRAKKIFTEE